MKTVKILGGAGQTYSQKGDRANAVAEWKKPRWIRLVITTDDSSADKPYWLAIQQVMPRWKPIILTRQTAVSGVIDIPTVLGLGDVAWRAKLSAAERHAAIAYGQRLY